jgi:hypothetical protein
VAPVSARYLDLARKPKRELEAVFAAGSPPDITALTGSEFRGYNRPRAAALLGIRKFIKAFYLDTAGRPLRLQHPGHPKRARRRMARPAQRRAPQTVRLLPSRTRPPRRTRPPTAQRGAPRLQPRRQPGLRHRQHPPRLPGARRTGSDELLLGKAFLRRRRNDARPQLLLHRALPAAHRRYSAR